MDSKLWRADSSLNALITKKQTVIVWPEAEGSLFRLFGVVQSCSGGKRGLFTEFYKETDKMSREMTA